MEIEWTEVSRQAPSLFILGIVLITVLLAFLKHLKARDEIQNQKDIAFTRTLEKRDSALVTIGDSCHNFQRECLQSLKDIQQTTIAALQENTRMCGEVSTKLTTLERLERQRFATMD
jgi:hypothetical protein